MRFSCPRENDIRILLPGYCIIAWSLELQWLPTAKAIMVSPEEEYNPTIRYDIQYIPVQSTS